MKSILKKEAGLTLIELMIVLVLAAVVTASIFATFIAQQKSYATQTRVSDMQQNARAALTMMERDLRMAGSNVGSSVFSMPDFWGNAISQPITITNRSPNSRPEITVVYAAQADQAISYVTNVNNMNVTLTNVTGFGIANGRQFIAFETVNGVYTINNIDIPGKTLTLTNAPPAHLANMRQLDPVTQLPILDPPVTGSPVGARAYLVRAITYQLDRARNTLERVASDQIGTAQDPNDLWDDIANYITDLQIVRPFNGDNNLLQVTLTSQDTDTDGTRRTRQHQAVINIRN